MRRSIIIQACSLLLFFSCSVSRPKEGKDYAIGMDRNKKILTGRLNRTLVENDTAFNWFRENIKYGEPEASAVEAIKKNASKFRLVVVTGTWCEDSQNLLPKFYRLLSAAGYPESKVLLIGVDRKKIAFKDKQAPYHITNTPTFIVMRNGKEVGRVVEFGKTGNMEKEVGEIIAGL